MKKFIFLRQLNQADLARLRSKLPAAAAAASGIPSDLLEAVKGVYERTQADAERQVRNAREEHLTALEAVQQHLRECLGQHDMLSQSAASLSADLARARETLLRLQAEQQSEKILVATLQADNSGLEQRLAARAAEVKVLGDQLGNAHGQFEHYQESIAAQRSEERQAFEQRTVRLEQDLAVAQQRLLGQQTTIAGQDMQLAQLRTDIDTPDRRGISIDRHHRR